MPFADAVRTLNTFRRRRIIRDYVIIGAVAATAYMEPIFTEDLDIIVLAETDDEYLRTFRRVSELAEGSEGMHYILGGLPVQMFPTATKPLYRDTLEGAHQTRIGNLRSKVASPEHLILLYLESFRDRDKFRILQLLGMVEESTLEGLLRRFDDEEGTLASRLKTLR